MKQVLFILLLILAVGCKKDKQPDNDLKNELLSGGNTTSFVRMFSADSWADAWSIRQTADGGYLCTGSTIQNEVLKSFLMKLNAKGETVSRKQIPNSDFGAELENTSDGCLIMSNTYNSVNPYASNLPWLQAEIVKIDAQGTELWRKSYSISSKHRLTDFKQAGDGGLILAGLLENGDGFLIKTDAAGNELWRKTYANFTITEVSTISGNGFVLCGARNAAGGNEHAYVMRTAADGNILWSRVLISGSSSSFSRTHCVTETPEGSIAIGGASYVPNQTGFIWLLDAAGLNLWNKNTDLLNPTAQETLGNQPLAILPTQDNQLMFTDMRGYLRKQFLNGDEIWHRKVTYSSDRIVSIGKTSDNGFIIAGGSSSFIITKTDAQGN